MQCVGAAIITTGLAVWLDQIVAGIVLGVVVATLAPVLSYWVLRLVGDHAAIVIADAQICSGVCAVQTWWRTEAPIEWVRRVLVVQPVSDERAEADSERFRQMDPRDESQPVGPVDLEQRRNAWIELQGEDDQCFQLANGYSVAMLTPLAHTLANHIDRVADRSDPVELWLVSKESSSST